MDKERLQLSVCLGLLILGVPVFMTVLPRPKIQSDPKEWKTEGVMSLKKPKIHWGFRLGTDPLPLGPGVTASPTQTGQVYCLWRDSITARTRQVFCSRGSESGIWPTDVRWRSPGLSSAQQWPWGPVNDLDHFFFLSTPVRACSCMILLSCQTEQA